MKKRPRNWSIKQWSEYKVRKKRIIDNLSPQELELREKLNRPLHPLLRKVPQETK